MVPEKDINLLSSHIDNFNTAKIMVIGDIILDNFVYGSVNRISPEAPVPVFSVSSEKMMLGGAGNVIRNIVSLGGNACFVSVVGDDAIGKQLTRMIGEEKNIEAYLQVEKARISSKKTRFIASNQQLLRADHETIAEISASTEDKIIQLIASAMPSYDVVVLSDYAKGVLTKKIISETINLANKHGKFVIVDPKSKDFSSYRGASLITPNLKELKEAGKIVSDNENSITEGALQLKKQNDFGNILVTRGKQGMLLVDKNNKTSNFASSAREVYDVSGAGDTVVATLATAIASGLKIEDAVYFSNVAAGVVVERLGTSIVSKQDLKAAVVSRNIISESAKILPASEAAIKIASWRQAGYKIGFTNGCFDLIHPGHVSLLAQAKNGCDKLIVGLNSDSSVKTLKGESRPIQNEISRGLVLASLNPVDLVVIFEEDTPVELIKNFKPDILVKGADYTIDKVVGADIVQAYGGKVILAQLSDGHSTTGMIKKIGS